MTVCKESVIENDDPSGSLPLRQQQTNNNNNNSHINNNNATSRRQNLLLPLAQHKVYGGGGGSNREINIIRSSFSNGLVGGGGTSGSRNSGVVGFGSATTPTFSHHNNNGSRKGSTNCNNNNCVRSCSEVFVKRHSFSLRLDMSPADGGDGGSRKALFTPEEMGVRSRRYDSTVCEREPRLVLKSGVLNAQEVNVEEKGQRYFADIFTTLVDMRWRWTMFYFTISYVLSWFGFAVIWWTILKSHGDMEHFEEEGWEPCVVGVKSFTSVFLFSLESQHTIGYGYHRMTDECPEAITLLSVQSIAGVLIEALSVGVFIVKLSKPKKRSQTLIFSKNALVCQKDGQMYLKFRLADIRHESKLLETHVRAQVIYKKTAPDGEVESIVQKELTVGAFDEDEDRILLYWPTTIVHEINEESPFYEMSCDDLAKAQGNNGSGGTDWEVIAVLEGVVESTGMTTQARTSYLPSEILWGRKFRSMMRSKGGAYVVDFDLFNSTISCDETPLCSPKTWAESKERHRNSSSSGSSNGGGGGDAADANGNSQTHRGGHRGETGVEEEKLEEDANNESSS